MAGPDRPLPKQKQPQRPSMPERAEGEAGSAASGLSAQNIANSASSGVSNLYSRLNNALAERGCVHIQRKGFMSLTTCPTYREMLGNLEDSFANLESGSKNMLAQVCHLQVLTVRIRAYVCFRPKVLQLNKPRRGGSSSHKYI